MIEFHSIVKSDLISKGGNCV